VTTSFVHLHLHSEFSLADGIVRLDDLASQAAAAGMPAVALTDLTNVFGAVKFYQATIKAGLKPIIGVDLWIENSTDRNKPFRAVLLCMNREGYQNLNRIVTRAYEEGQHAGRACIAPAWLAGATNGLIMLSGATDGDVGQALLAGHRDLAARLAQGYAKLFPDRFYLELQRTGQPHQEDYIAEAVALAGRLTLPVVATNAVQFLRAEDFDAHEVRVCIQEGRVLADPRRPRLFTREQYLRTPAEMQALFADLPEAIANTVEIARRCNFRLESKQNHLPNFPVPAGEAVEDVLRRRAAEGLSAHLAKLPSLDAAGRQQYDDRLVMELEVIIKMGFAGYYLIVADFIEWARRNDVPVGPGRGSGAGSLVAWCVGITALDPIKYELLFERFLNPERISLPDFDVDFCIEGRDRVIGYVSERYGHDHVCQIITHGTMAAKAVVRDVGRVLDHPYGYVDKLAKLIPFELEMTLDKALDQEPQLRERYEKEEDVRDLIDMARALEGLARSAGKHAAGVVIAPSPLTDFMPLYCEQGSSQHVTQFDMGDVEKLGLVKFDFLGLRNLTIIDRALKLINTNRAAANEPPVIIDDLPLDDAQTYALLKACRTTALFQLESRGMKDLIQRLQPDRFEEIVALVALFRPGPLQSGMVDDFINRKHGRQRLAYPHPSLEPILKPTYGVILYQEQVMQIAQVLSGYSLGKADLLRRAMGKKKPEEMAAQRDGFVKGAEERGVDGKLAAHIFDLIEKFAGYGFNRSHSAAYALIAYQTAWLKTHYPAAFMAAVLTSDMEKTEKVVTMISECRDMKLKVLPPDINRCEYPFVVIDPETILYGLGAIKGLGQSAIEAILEARRAGGAFKDLFDLCRRIDLRRVNRRVMESLIRAGALDALGQNRAVLSASLNAALMAADRHARDSAAGQNDIFGSAAQPVVELHYVDVPDWSEETRLEGEKETLGLYLTGHPIARFEQELARFIDSTIADLRPAESRLITVAGLVVGMRTMQTRRGDRMAFVTLDDRTGRLELAVFSEQFEKHRDLLAKDTLLIVRGQVSVDEYSGGFKMSAEELYGIDTARAAFAMRLEIDVDAEQAGNGFVGHLQRILKPATPGRCPVLLKYRRDGAQADIVLGDEWRVTPSSAVLEHLSGLAGQGRVRVIYPPSTRA
jgi:DNA polymerase-3 subunit alpha